MNNKKEMNYISEEIRLEKKKRKDMWIFYMYMTVGSLGLLGACYSDTIPQCIIFVVVFVFIIVSGFVIKKLGTVDY